MKKLILANVFGGIVFLQGCAGVSMGWEPIDPKVGIPVGNGNYVFKNIVYFKNTTPYCVAKISSVKVKQPVHQKTRFNPVKKTFVLDSGGEEGFIQYSFNTNNHYRTKIDWYFKGRRINSEYIGHVGSGDEYTYNVNRYHMGEQRINLTNQHREECWKRSRKDVNINIYQ